VIGNGVATPVVAKWTGALDVVTMRRELGGERLAEPRRRISGEQSEG
jgi:hypothetical protein